MDDKIAAWLDYLASQRGLATSTQREYRRDMRLLVAHLVDQDSRRFLAGVAQQYSPIADVGDITAEHLAAFLVHPTPPRAWSFPNPNRSYQRGANLREVQELLGHASPTTTATTPTSPTVASTTLWPAWPRYRWTVSTDGVTVDNLHQPSAISHLPSVICNP